MEKMPIFALSSFCNKRSDERLSTPVGFFYAPVRPICGSVTPCRSSNARQLVASSTAGSAGPFFISAHQPVIVFKLCRMQQTIAGRRAKCAPPAARTQSSQFRQPTPSSRECMYTSISTARYSPPPSPGGIGSRHGRQRPCRPLSSASTAFSGTGASATTAVLTSPGACPSRQHRPQPCATSQMLFTRYVRLMPALSKFFPTK